MFFIDILPLLFIQLDNNLSREMSSGEFGVHAVTRKFRDRGLLIDVTNEGWRAPRGDPSKSYLSLNARQSVTE